MRCCFALGLIGFLAVGVTAALCDNSQIQERQYCMSNYNASHLCMALAAITFSGTLGFGQSSNVPIPLQDPHGQHVGYGGSGVTLTPLSAQGTVVVAMALSEGLVLAADSRLTLQFNNFNPNYKVASDNNSKVFSVGRFAIATFGEAFLEGRSIGSLVGDFRFGLKDDPKRSVDSFAKEFSDYITPIYDRNSKSTNSMPVLGFVVEGYDTSGIGKILEVSFPAPRIPVELNNTKNKQGAIWRGHTDVIARLIKGFDGRIGTLPAFAALPQDAQTQLATQLNGLEYFVPWQYLQLQDGIDLAESLVRITVDVQRFSFGTNGSPGDIPSVGGRVDALAITPIELIWVSQKKLTSSQ